MSDVARYSAVEPLRNGRRIEIRALRPDDRRELLAAVNRTSAQSLYRRFFAARKSFTEKEVAFFLNVDFVSHVALVAVMKENEGQAICGGGRFVVVQPGKAELAFLVVDQYQGQGIGAALLRHLIAIARAAGMHQGVHCRGVAGKRRYDEDIQEQRPSYERKMGAQRRARHACARMRLLVAGTHPREAGKGPPCPWV
jgi:GNAT superfamily N-acetyltransferase